MRVVPLNELVERIAHAAPCALLFPFDSPRAARSGDPAVHTLRDAQELFVLALLRLTARLGEPDFPSANGPTARDISGSMLPFAAWDYDDYAMVLEIVPIDGVGDAYSVQLRRTSGVQFMSGSAHSPLHEARTFADLERFLQTWTNFRGDPTYDAMGIAVLFLGCLDNMRRSYIEGSLRPMRELTLQQLEIFAALGLLDKAVPIAIRKGTGPLDAARDGQQIAGVFAEHAADFAGKHPFTKVQLDKLREDGDWLVPALRPASAKIAPTERDPAAILRDQLGAMLVDRYELARQAGGVLFGLRDLDARIPPLGARIGSARSSTPESPAPTPESSAPSAPANG